MQSLIGSKLLRVVLLPVIAVLGTGCGIGTRTMLFATNTSIGVNIDTEPPTSSIAYKRQEIVIAPEYPGGEVLPVLASIDMNVDTGFNVLVPFLGFDVNQRFITGDAAVIYADELRTNGDSALALDTEGWTADKPSTIDLSDHEVAANCKWINGLVPGFLWAVVNVVVGDHVDYDEKRPYFFGTNTIFGLDVKYSTEGYPRAIALGFKRQEVAVVPIMEKVVEKKVESVRLPSLFASFNGGAGVSTEGEASSVKTSAGLKAGSIMATGLAADLIASSDVARPLMDEAFFGGPLVTATYGVDDKTECIENYLAAGGDDAASEQRWIDVQAWVDANIEGGLMLPTILYGGEDHAANRKSIAEQFCS